MDKQALEMHPGASDTMTVSKIRKKALRDVGLFWLGDPLKIVGILFGSL